MVFFKTRGVTEFSNLCFETFATSPSLSLPHHALFSLSFWYLLVPLLVWPPFSEVEGHRALAGYEAPWRGERDRGRRPRQYICPGENRKTSERFRTQPITSAERQETDRYCYGLKNAWLRVKNAGKYPCDHACQRNHVDFFYI